MNIKDINRSNSRQCPFSNLMRCFVTISGSKLNFKISMVVQEIFNVLNHIVNFIFGNRKSPAKIYYIKSIRLHQHRTSGIRIFSRWCIRRHHHSSSTKRPRIKYKPQFRTQDLTNTINNLFVVAALLVDAAFIGALQMPLKGDNVDQEDKDLLGKYVLTTIITMNLSVTAALTLCLALLLDTNLALILVSIAFLLLELAFAFVGYARF
ncbi:hypothetical protein EZV62_020430 [Acer yangbiense]|uniref:PGG domain-containing protein n=1 Tax=Acer yangbiense TaxID=1000413 RepID=A0A5C7HDU3_9ROSI|nr:hypothetical protein EZV62_020430 [Acer yangbiense]